MERSLDRPAPASGLVASVRSATGLLTRLPVGASVGDDPGAAAFALVGAAVGCIAAVPIALLTLAGEPVLGAIASVATMAAVSGGLHLDGLADTADALIAPDPAAAERAREDPAVGPGGAATLLLVLGSQVAAVASIATVSGPLLAGTIVIVGGALSRWMPVLTVLLLRGPVAVGGLAAWFSARVSVRDALVGGGITLVTVVVGVVLAGVTIALGAGTGAAVGIALTAVVVRVRGALDGDGLGASVEIAFTATVVGLALVVR